MLKITLSPFATTDVAEMAEIYNYYVENTTATFELQPLTIEEMERRTVGIAEKYPCQVARMADGTMVGYCYAHAWKSFAAYATTLETTVYLRPGFTSKGVGRALMVALIEECRSRGYKVLIACITAENEGSIRFHESLGFEPVSHFRGVGLKFDRLLDVVDLQYTI